MFKIPVSDFKEVFYVDVKIPQGLNFDTESLDIETNLDKNIFAMNITIEYSLKPTKEFEEWAAANYIKYILDIDGDFIKTIELFSESDYVLFKLKWIENAGTRQ